MMALSTTMPRILAIIQARMASSRLPDKVLLDIGGQPMLTRVVERVRRAKTVDEVVVATTVEPADDAIAAFCAQQGYLWARGSLHDVLDRYYQAARQFGAEVIVRITADCPVIDPKLVDEAVMAFLNNPYDFVANRLPPPWPRTYPIGLDTEVCSFELLEKAWKEAVLPYQREHVMPFIYDHGVVIDSLTKALLDPPVSVKLQHTGIPFRILLLNHTPSYGDLRWTVDTPADLELLRQVYARFSGCDDFTWQEVLALFEREPELARINAQVTHKDYRQVDHRRDIAEQ
jgi:spore coat polysaccharide biosynthesis protein SpsF